MIWIVILLAVLCIAMSRVALWYREKWQDAEKRSIRCEELERQNRELSIGQRITISDNANMLASSINLQNELIVLRGKYVQLKGELGDMEVKCRNFRDHINILRSQLPKRDSRGRFCKREEEK